MNKFELDSWAQKSSRGALNIDFDSELFPFTICHSSCEFLISSTSHSIEALTLDNWDWSGRLLVVSLLAAALLVVVVLLLACTIVSLWLLIVLTAVCTRWYWLESLSLLGRSICVLADASLVVALLLVLALWLSIIISVGWGERKSRRFQVLSTSRLSVWWWNVCVIKSSAQGTGDKHWQDDEQLHNFNWCTSQFVTAALNCNYTIFFLICLIETLQLHDDSRERCIISIKLFIFRGVMNATTVQIRLMILNDAADGFIPKQKKRAFKSLRRYYYAAALSSKTHTAEKKPRSVAAVCERWRCREFRILPLNMWATRARLKLKQSLLLSSVLHRNARGSRDRISHYTRSRRRRTLSARWSPCGVSVYLTFYMNSFFTQQSKAFLARLPNIVMSFWVFSSRFAFFARFFFGSFFFDFALKRFVGSRRTSGEMNVKLQLVDKTCKITNLAPVYHWPTAPLNCPGEISIKNFCRSRLSSLRDWKKIVLILITI